MKHFPLRKLRKLLEAMAELGLVAARARLRYYGGFEVDADGEWSFGAQASASASSVIEAPSVRAGGGRRQVTEVVKLGDFLLEIDFEPGSGGEREEPPGKG